MRRSSDVQNTITNISLFKMEFICYDCILSSQLENDNGVIVLHSLNRNDSIYLGFLWNDRDPI